jgi:hypothetical protein
MDLHEDEGLKLLATLSVVPLTRTFMIGPYSLYIVFHLRRSTRVCDLCAIGYQVVTSLVTCSYIYVVVHTLYSLAFYSQDILPSQV